MLSHMGVYLLTTVELPWIGEIDSGKPTDGRVVVMAALWISLAVVVVLLLTWRLRRAARKLDQILREERELTAEEEAAGSRRRQRAGLRNFLTGR